MEVLATVPPPPFDRANSAAEERQLIRRHLSWRRRIPMTERLAISVLCLLFALSGNSQLSHLEQIEARGALIMLTLNGATTYFVGAEGETGFEHDLALYFAEHVNIPLEVIPVPTIADLIPYLQAGRGDFIAANLSRTIDRKSDLRFGPVYEVVQPIVVYRRGTRRPQSLEDMLLGEIVIPTGTTYAAILEQSGLPLNWREDPYASIEDLLDAVSSETIDYTIVDSNILELNRRFFPAVRPGFELPDQQELAWATRRMDDDSLMQAMRGFFHLAQRDDIIAEVRQRHFDHVDNFEPVGTFTFLARVRERLPGLRQYFEQAADDYDFDWRLLAAIGYQESHWDPDAVSRTGVRGIMMLTQRTARQVGIEDRLDPAQSIEGGARYLRLLLERLPERIEEPDRLWLALAAYNVGFGHLEDARVLTQRRGGDPDRWLDVRDTLPLLTQERWHRQTRFGYARGYEPVHFVENVRTFFEILLWMEGRDHPLLAIQAEDTREI